MIIRKIAAGLFCLAVATAAGAQAMLSEKVYDTGKPLQKPMVMLPFTEFHSARKTPDLDLRTLEGKKVDLGQYKGKVLILNVWATWCAPCLREIPALMELQKRLESTNVRLVGLSVDEDPTQIPGFLMKFKFTGFDTWLDPTQNIDSLMPLSVVPTNYVFDGSGNLIGFLRGYLPWEDPEVLPFLEKLGKKYADK